MRSASSSGRPRSPPRPRTSSRSAPWLRSRPSPRSGSNLDAGEEKEAHEGELLAPQDDFTVTDSYDIDNFGEIGLAQGVKPLIQPTDVEDFQEGDPEGVAADNAARAITLDDGASINFRDVANQDTAYPWLSPTNPVRVGAKVTFTGNVVLEFRNNLWKFQPRQRVLGEGASTATFQDTRDRTLPRRSAGTCGSPPSTC